MKSKIATLNLYLMAAVLFTILFQSVHQYGELVADYFEQTEKSSHSHDGLSHQHSDDDCSVCDFSFWYYLEPTVLTYRFDFPLKPIPYIYGETEIHSCFSGSLFSLRGPPQNV